MKVFANLKSNIHNEKGITLIELLAALAILGIVLTLINSVFIMGINAYKKIGIEGQLRDEADYVITSVMNKIYANPPDYIQYCPDTDEKTCIQFIDDQFVKQEELNIRDGTFIDIIPNADKGENSTTTQFSAEGSQIKIDSEILNSSNKIDFTGSEFSFQCIDDNRSSDSTCKNAIINIKISVEHLDYKDDSALHVKPIELHSKFGF